MITRESFGKTAAGEEIAAYTFHDGGNSATVISYGAAVQSVKIASAAGEPVEVLLGHAGVEGYEKNRGCLGAVVGRCCNRTKGGVLFAEGREYRLSQNDGNNHKHGGFTGFQKKAWAHRAEGDEVIFTLVSPDGEEGYPSALTVTVIYTFCGGELKIRYRAVSDKLTAVNLTNHSYFNLSGETDGNICDHELWLDSDYITVNDENQVPVGGFRAVKGTPFDFNTPKKIGRDIDADDCDIEKGNGYDHCYLLKNGQGEYVRYAFAKSPKTGIEMTCYTDMPAVQFYSGNGLKQQGRALYYGARAGFCLEAQLIPNNVNVPEYAARGSSYLSAGQEYAYTCAYRFRAK